MYVCTVVKYFKSSPLHVHVQVYACVYMFYDLPKRPQLLYVHVTYMYCTCIPYCIRTRGA